MWVDRASGYPLGEVNESPEAEGYGRWFVRPEIGIPLDDSLFRWDGPSVTDRELRELKRRERQALQDSQMRWFRENVLAGRLTAQTTLDLLPEQITFRDNGDEDVVGGTVGVFRFERTTPDSERKSSIRDADVAWRSGDHDWRVSFGSPEVIVDEKLRDEVRRRISGKEAGE